MTDIFCQDFIHPMILLETDLGSAAITFPLLAQTTISRTIQHSERGVEL